MGIFADFLMATFRVTYMEDWTVDAEHYSVLTPGTSFLGRSTKAVIIGEGMQSKMGGLISVPATYGDDFSICFACAPGSYTIYYRRNSSPITWAIPALFREVTQYYHVQSSPFPVVRPGEEYNDLWISPDNILRYSGHLFSGINDETFFHETNYGLDIIIPKGTYKLSALIESLQSDRVNKRRRYYQEVYVFAARGTGSGYR